MKPPAPHTTARFCSPSFSFSIVAPLAKQVEDLVQAQARLVARGVLGR